MRFLWLSRRPCSRPLTQLSSYLDEELDEHTSSDLQVHVGECLRCRASLEELRLAKACLKQFQIPAVNHDRFNSPHLQLFEANNNCPIWIRVWRKRISLPVPAAATLMLFMAATLLINQMSFDDPTIPAVNLPAGTLSIDMTREVRSERLIVRTVYIRGPKRALRTFADRSRRHKDTVDSQSLTTASLEDFRPATNINLRVVTELQP